MPILKAHLVSYQTHLEVNPWKSHWMISDIAAYLSLTHVVGHWVCYALLAVLPADALQLQKQVTIPAAWTLKGASRQLPHGQDGLSSYWFVSPALVPKGGTHCVQQFTG